MSLAEEYEQQYRWRAWDQVYEQVPLAPGHVVLDLGCAIGHQSAALAARGATVVGYDGNDELLSVARARAIPGASFRQADLRHWSDPGLGADGLWASFVPAYFPQFGPVLHRWSAALRPGGWLVLIEIDRLMHHAPMSEALDERLSSYYDHALRQGQYDFRMGGKLATFAAEAGLEIVREFDLPDREIAFDGPALPEVMQAWRSRFDRLRSMKAFFGDEFAFVRDEILEALASPTHRSVARVRGIEARVPE